MTLNLKLNTKTPDRRREIKEWLMSTVYPSLEELKRETKGSYLVNWYYCTLRFSITGYIRWLFRSSKIKRQVYLGC